VEVDLSLFKTFALREHLSLQARAEVSILRTTQISRSPNTTVFSSGAIRPPGRIDQQCGDDIAANAVRTEADFLAFTLGRTRIELEFATSRLSRRLGAGRY